MKTRKLALNKAAENTPPTQHPPAALKRNTTLSDSSVPTLLQGGQFITNSLHILQKYKVVFVFTCQSQMLRVSFWHMCFNDAISHTDIQNCPEVKPETAQVDGKS